MAESKGALLAKSVQKHAGRAKEKILQNLGKVDRTADDIFDEHLTNFTRQQNAANRLQKEFNNYIRCIRAVQAASKTLMDSLNEIYESNWVGHDLLYVQSQNIEMLWQDFSHKLGDQVLIPLNTYQSQFPEMRKKIDKRGRKLVDYDSQRHNFQSLQGNPKKRDEIKVTKARESLEEAKRTYELLNSELHDELPALHDSRVLFLVTNLQTLFAAEQVFHAETAKVYAELEAIVDKLASDCQRGTYTLKKSSPKSPKTPTSNSKIISSVPSSPTSVAGEKEKSSYLPEQGPSESQMATDHQILRVCGEETMMYSKITYFLHEYTKACSYSMYAFRKELMQKRIYANICTFTILQSALNVILAGGHNRNWKRVLECKTVYSFSSCTLERSASLLH